MVSKEEEGCGCACRMLLEVWLCRKLADLMVNRRAIHDLGVHDMVAS